MWEANGEGISHFDSGDDGGWNYVEGAAFLTSDDGLSRSSEFSQHQDENYVEQPSPLGLSLRKTPSFVNLIENALCQTKEKQYVDDFSSRVPMAEKLKASNFVGSLLRIGEWEFTSQHDGNLVAKCYYAKRKLVWEILDGPLKSKIEIQWSDIIGIKATNVGTQPAILEIELNQPPLFYRETDPQPRKHTIWKQSHDFTGDQASICRRHYLRCPPGALDNTFEKILLCDQRLNNLSRRPFPSRRSPFFEQNVYENSKVYVDGYGSRHHHQEWQCQHQNYPATFVQPHVQTFKMTNEQHCGSYDSNSSMSAMSFNGVNDQTNNYEFAQMGDELWTQEHVWEIPNITAEESSLVFPNQEVHVYRSYDGETEHKGVIKQLENHFLEEECQLSPRSQHLYFSLLNPVEGVNMNSNAFMENAQENVLLVGNVMLPYHHPSHQQ